MTEGRGELNRDATAEDELGPSARPTLLLPEHAPSTGEPIPEQAPPAPRTWRQELPRWLATLDGARTRREYEKAVGYFFTAPSVPQALSDLSFDLLLAYRGSLALRTQRSTETRAQRATPSRGTRRDELRGGAASGRPALSAAERNDDVYREEATIGEEQGRAASAATPLAPATVNVRLTALRQFLAHCSLWDQVPQLAPERIKAALPRLSIERRRPYQVLAEPDWAGFLAAARGPLAYADPEAGSTSLAATSSDMEPHGASATPERDAVGAEPAARVRPQSPWGTPRTARQRLVARMPGGGGAAAEAAQKPPLRRSRAGLTGEHTAQRDHTLLSLALATGLRAVELCALDLGDLTREWHEGREEWWLVLPDAKTKGQRGGRTLPLAANVSEILLAYVRATGRRWENADDRATPLFLPHTRRRAAQVRGSAQSAPSGRLSTAQIRNIVDRVEAQWASEDSETGAADRRAHVPLISPHALRHSTAVALLEGNRESGRDPASVEHVRSWLGHIDIRTTQGYLAHVDTRRHRRPFAVKLNTDAAPGRQEDQVPAPRPDEAT